MASCLLCALALDHYGPLSSLDDLRLGEHLPEHRSKSSKSYRLGALMLTRPREVAVSTGEARASGARTNP